MVNYEALNSPGGPRAPLRIDVTALQPFEYPRRIHDGEIRILTMHNGDFKSVIRCDMTTESLVNSDSYHAVSYHWGDPARSKWILVNGLPFPITTNAHEALQYLRSESTPSRLWIDAVCINQSDVEEKNIQVQQMRQIYEHAATTYAWLGPPHPDLPRALDLFVECTKGATTGRHLLVNYASIKEILCRPWMSRVWIVQEATLSPECIVFYGHSRCALWDLLAFLDVWNGANILMADVLEIDPTWGEPGGLKHHLRLLHTLRMTWISVKYVRPMPLLMQLNHIRERGCSNARDYYYGLRGIDERLNGARGIKVDYTGEVGVLFTDVTRRGMLDDQMGNNYLCSIRDVKHVVSEAYDLPSWVPDWGASSSLINQYPAALFAANGVKATSLTETAFINNGRTLAIRGIIVSQVSARFQDEIQADGRLWHSREIDNLLDWTSTDCTVPLQYHGIDNVVEALARTLTMDIISRSNRDGFKRWPKEDSRLPLRPWLGKYALEYAALKARQAVDDDTNERPQARSNVSMEEMLIFEDEFWNGFNHASEGRSFAITHDGAFALCPPNTGVGDLVIIVDCMPAPLILRRQQADRARLLMVGPAYVHGIMDGEAMARLDEGKYRWEDIVID